jgi:sensor histidine kinase YesM
MGLSRKIFDAIMNTWWLRHLLFWITCLIYYSFGTYSAPTTFLNEVLQNSKYLPGHFLVVYPLLYILIPRFLIPKKIFLFVIGYLFFLSLAIIYLSLANLDFNSTKFSGFRWDTGKNVLPFIHVSGLAATVKLVRHTFMQEKIAANARSQKTLAELQLLKAQVHPHFLFNTLNNLFAHTLKKSSESSNIVLKLSELLRFMIYDSKDELITLDQEISLLNNYIDLEKLRYGKELDVSVQYSGNIQNKLISPLLLLPLIENSFKHGTSQQLDRKWLTMDLHVEHNTMHFKLANSRDPDLIQSHIIGKSKGIGLENVQRRLELLYPGKYEFNIIEEKHMYMVILNLELEPIKITDTQKKSPKQEISTIPA